MGGMIGIRVNWPWLRFGGWRSDAFERDTVLEGASEGLLRASGLSFLDSSVSVLLRARMLRAPKTMGVAGFFLP